MQFQFSKVVNIHLRRLCANIRRNFLLFVFVVLYDKFTIESQNYEFRQIVIRLKYLCKDLNSYLYQRLSKQAEKNLY